MVTRGVRTHTHTQHKTCYLAPPPAIRRLSGVLACAEKAAKKNMAALAPKILGWMEGCVVVVVGSGGETVREEN